MLDGLPPFEPTPRFSFDDLDHKKPEPKPSPVKRSGLKPSLAELISMPVGINTPTISDRASARFGIPFTFNFIERGLNLEIHPKFTPKLYKERFDIEIKNKLPFPLEANDLFKLEIEIIKEKSRLNDDKHALVPLMNLVWPSSLDEAEEDADVEPDFGDYTINKIKEILEATKDRETFAVTASTKRFAEMWISLSEALENFEQEHEACLDTPIVDLMDSDWRGEDYVNSLRTIKDTLMWLGALMPSSKRELMVALISDYYPQRVEDLRDPAFVADMDKGQLESYREHQYNKAARGYLNSFRDFVIEKHSFENDPEFDSPWHFRRDDKFDNPRKHLASKKEVLSSSSIKPTLDIISLKTGRFKR